jgi:hypothetical protein
MRDVPILFFLFYIMGGRSRESNRAFHHAELSSGAKSAVDIQLTALNDESKSDGENRQILKT